MERESSKILVEEHKNILKVVEALSKEIEQGKDIDEKFFRSVIDFIRNYADKFHHAKEEDILFKEFGKCAEEGDVHCNPVEQMLFEHDEGRNFVKGMEEALEKKDKGKLILNARGYINLIQEHIFKEDTILFPMVDDALNKETEKEMLTKFKEIAKKNKNEEEKHLNFIRDLS